MLITSIPLFSNTALAADSAQSPRAGVCAISPASARVGEEYSEKLYRFSDNGFERSMEAVPVFTPTGSTQVQDRFPEGLELSSDGVLSGTPGESGTLSLTLVLSWENSDYQPEFIKNDKRITLSILPESTEKQLPADDENVTVIDKYGFDEVIEPKAGGEWYSFTAPCVTLYVDDEVDNGDTDDNSTDSQSAGGGQFTGDFTLIDKNGYTVLPSGDGSASSDDKSRIAYYVTPGAQYFAKASTPFCIAPITKDVSEIATGSDVNIRIPGNPVRQSVERSFEDEDNTLWDVYRISVSSPYNMGILDYGYMYACSSVSYVAPYKVYFDEADFRFTKGEDVYVLESEDPNETGLQAFIHSSEQMSTYTGLHYAALPKVPDDQALMDGVAFLDLDVYVPAGKSFQNKDGILRDTESIKQEKYKPQTVTASKLTGITNEAGGIRINWQRASDTTGYYLQRRLNSKKNNADAWQTIATIKKASTTTYLDKEVTEGTAYNYRIITVGNNDYAPNASGYKVMHRLSKPKLGSVSNKKTRRLVVKWSSKEKCDGYQIVYTKFSIEKGKTVYVSGASKNKCTLKNLTKGKTYKVYIRTFKKYKIGDSDYRSFSAWSSVKKARINK